MATKRKSFHDSERCFFSTLLLLTSLLVHLDSLSSYQDVSVSLSLYTYCAVDVDGVGWEKASLRVENFSRKGGKERESKREIRDENEQEGGVPNVPPTSLNTHRVFM